MRVALAQTNPVIGDFEGNLQRAEARLDEARRAGADLVVFPELTLVGYPPHDLLEKRGFIERNREALDRFAAGVRGLGAVVGFVDENPGPAGKPLRNAVALIEDGQVVRVAHKCLLPTYDVFDEHRHFAPAARVTEPVVFRGRRLALTVCEDIWNDADLFPRRLYDRDPVADLAAAGYDLLINVSASPFTLGKPELRERLVAHAARKYGRPVVMVNQVGGQDDILFDGGSLAVDADGRVTARCADFQEDLAIVDLDSGLGPIHQPDRSFAPLVWRALVTGIRDYARKCGFQRAVVGLSGGIDSALVVCLAVEALGADQVFGVAMPAMYSAPVSLWDARELAGNLGIRLEVMPLPAIYNAYLRELGPLFADRPFGVAEENLQARIRGALLMAVSNKFGHLLLSTGNKSELAVGYSTLYGDMCGGLAVIADLLKTKVFELARWVNREGVVIPERTLTRPPSAELRPDQTDQDELPPYEILDEILARYIEQQLTAREIEAQGFDPALVRRVVTLVDRNEYKRRQAPPCLKVTAKAFGVGRRLPITQRFHP